jgi:hypothetical protein
LAVEARTRRRTALVALRGELDLATVSKVAELLVGAITRFSPLLITRIPHRGSA